MDRHSHATSWLHSYNLSVDESTLRIGTDKKNLILGWQDAEKVTFLTLPTQARRDAAIPMRRSRLIEILIVPHSGHELSWQLGGGRVRKVCLPFRIDCGLAERSF